MIPQETVVEIHALHKQGLSICAIARQLGLPKNMVKRFLRQPSKLLTFSKRQRRPSKLDPYKAHIYTRIAATKPYWIPAAILYREVKALLGYDSCEVIVRDYVSRLKPNLARPVVCFETQPAEQLQVDFTMIKRGRQSLKAFVATLGYSRASFVRFTSSGKQ